MKSTIISMLIVLVLMVALPMIFLGNHKLPDLSGFHFARPGASSGVKLSSGIADVATDKPVHIYRWRDAHGILQLSNTKPEGVNAQQIELKPNLSIMDPVKPLPDDTFATVTSQKTASAATSSDMHNPYTPDGMKQLVQQAGELKKALSQQQADQAKEINQVLGKKN
jgi:Sec-independent protein translocase protein TatA